MEETPRGKGSQGYQGGGPRAGGRGGAGGADLASQEARAEPVAWPAARVAPAGQERGAWAGRGAWAAPAG